MKRLSLSIVSVVAMVSAAASSQPATTVSQQTSKAGAPNPGLVDDLDTNAKALAQAIALGGSITYLTPEEAGTILAREDAGLERSWELWKRKTIAR